METNKKKKLYEGRYFFSLETSEVTFQFHHVARQHPVNENSLHLTKAWYSAQEKVNVWPKSEAVNYD